MTAWLRAAVCGLLAALVACAAPGGRASAATPNSAGAALPRELLVMLHAPAPHLQAGAGYTNDQPDYGRRPAMRRIADELARTHGLVIVDEWPMPVIGVDCFVMMAASADALGPVAAALARDPRVAWTQPVGMFRGQDGDDPLYPLQPAAKLWHIGELHRFSTGRGVRVAVIDSGVDVRQPDLAGQFDAVKNFVDPAQVPAEPHGTAVAGIIAARQGNGVGIAGVAPGARLLALRGCWQAPGQGARCTSFTLGKALNFAIEEHARVINLSVSGPPDRLLQALVEAADAHGATVVGAADPQGDGAGFPEAVPAVFVVAAQPRSVAPGRAVLAPGTDVPTCLPGKCWGLVSGSSFAAAHVSGLVALLAQLRPLDGPGQLKRDIVVVQETAPRTPVTNQDPHGAPAASVDACATIARVTATCTCSCGSNANTGAAR